MNPIRFHPAVQRDINEAIRYYRDISDVLAEGFWEELRLHLDWIRENPDRFHFDESGLRRCNLERFPFHILYEVLPDRVRVQVIRHHARDPDFGRRRSRK